MNKDFGVKLSLEDEDIILTGLKKFQDYNVKIPQKGIPVPLENGDIIRIMDRKKSGVEGGFIFSLCDKATAKSLDGQIYMGKIMFTSKDISGKKYRRSNAKNKITHLITCRIRDEINRDVIQEYISLKLANIVYDGISPEPKLGKISDDHRLFLMKKMLAQEDCEIFKTFEKLNSSDLSSIEKNNGRRHTR